MREVSCFSRSDRWRVAGLKLRCTFGQRSVNHHKKGVFTEDTLGLPCNYRKSPSQFSYFDTFTFSYTWNFEPGTLNLEL
jgi:hypothetical protein